MLEKTHCAGNLLHVSNGKGFVEFYITKTNTFYGCYFDLSDIAIINKNQEGLCASLTGENENNNVLLVEKDLSNHYLRIATLALLSHQKINNTLNTEKIASFFSDVFSQYVVSCSFLSNKKRSPAPNKISNIFFYLEPEYIFSLISKNINKKAITSNEEESQKGKEEKEETQIKDNSKLFETLLEKTISHLKNYTVSNNKEEIYELESDHPYLPNQEKLLSFGNENCQGLFIHFAEETNIDFSDYLAFFSDQECTSELARFSGTNQGDDPANFWPLCLPYKRAWYKFVSQNNEQNLWGFKFTAFPIYSLQKQSFELGLWFAKTMIQNSEFLEEIKSRKLFDSLLNIYSIARGENLKIVERLLGSLLNYSPFTEKVDLVPLENMVCKRMKKMYQKNENEKSKSNSLLGLINLMLQIRKAKETMGILDHSKTEKDCPWFSEIVELSSIVDHFYYKAHKHQAINQKKKDFLPTSIVNQLEKEMKRMIKLYDTSHPFVDDYSTKEIEFGTSTTFDSIKIKFHSKSKLPKWSSIEFCTKNSENEDWKVEKTFSGGNLLEEEEETVLKGHKFRYQIVSKKECNSFNQQCLNCSETIEGTAYFCINCQNSNYFCSKCISSNIDHSLDHILMKIHSPVDNSPPTSVPICEPLGGVIHFGETCSKCGQTPIKGTRYKCSNCIDYSLCSECEKKNDHQSNHIFLMIRSALSPGSSIPTFPTECLYNDCWGLRFSVESLASEEEQKKPEGEEENKKPQKLENSSPLLLSFKDAKWTINHDYSLVSYINNYSAKTNVNPFLIVPKTLSIIEEEFKNHALISSYPLEQLQEKFSLLQYFNKKLSKYVSYLGTSNLDQNWYLFHFHFHFFFDYLFKFYFFFLHFLIFFLIFLILNFFF